MTTSDFGNFNRAMDEVCRQAREADPREVQRRWRHSRAPLNALLDLAYGCDLERDPLGLTKPNAPQLLRTIIGSASWVKLAGLSMGHADAKMNPAVQAAVEKLSVVRRQIQAMLAGLVLRRIEGRPGGWEPAESTILGPTFWWNGDDGPRLVGLFRITPLHMEAVWAARDALLSGAEFLRACELCGMLFFRAKAKVQRFCHPKHEGVADRRGHTNNTGRGRPRTDYLGPVLATHARWDLIAEIHLEEVTGKQPVPPVILPSPPTTTIRPRREPRPQHRPKKHSPRPKPARR